MRLSSSKKPGDIAWDLVLITMVATLALQRTLLAPRLAEPVPALWSIPVLISYGLVLFLVLQQNWTLKKVFLSVIAGLMFGYILTAMWLSSRFDGLDFNLAFKLIVPEMGFTILFFSSGVSIALMVRAVSRWNKNNDK